MSQAVILMYHRVIDPGPDPWGLCVSPRHFEEQLQVLATHFHPVAMAELAAAGRAGSVPERGVAITFDDGYVDNLHNALPALRRRSVPATVFVVPGYLGRRQYWWDELETLFLRTATLPANLTLTVNGTQHQWNLGSPPARSGALGGDWARWRAWDDPPTARHALYLSLWQLLQPLPEESRCNALAELRKWSGVASSDEPTPAVMTLDDLHALAEDGLIEIGAHTMTHPVLSAISIARQREEIGRSKALIEEILQRQVSGFSYPYGARTNYSTDTVNAVRDAGYEYACSTTASSVTRGADPFQLPRFQVGDWSGDEFAVHLRTWFAGQ